MSADSLWRASKHQIFRAISVALRHRRDTVANRVTDAPRDAGAHAPTSGFNPAADIGSDGSADDGGVGHDHEFRLHALQP